MYDQSLMAATAYGDSKVGRFLYRLINIPGKWYENLKRCRKPLDLE